KVARDRQKSYADKRRKPLEFSVGDYVFLKVSPWKGVVRFGKKGKLAPRFVGPFEIIEKVGHVAYRLDLPEELNGVYDTFYVSNLKKCLADLTLKVPSDEIQVDAKLNFVEEPVEILEREFKKLKRSRIAIVKVRWNSKRGPEFTWERKDQMKLKYPHLFSNFSPLSGCDTITEYFSLLNTPADQRLQIVGFNLEGVVSVDVIEWFDYHLGLIRLRLKGTLNADEDIDVDEVSSAIDGVFDMGESNVESMVRSKFGEFSENNKSVEKVVGGGKVLGVGEDDDSGNAATDGGDDAVESGDISILNSLIGHGSPRSSQLRRVG
ncbi:hypothetical protein Tco_1168628, partial [Tanacetum coccineum]